MKTTKFVILRSRSKPVAEFGIMARGAGGPASGPSADVPGGGSVDLEVEAADLSKNDVHELGRDPSVLTAAPSMPMKLHQPRDVQDVNATDLAAVTWGVQAVRADQSAFDGSGVTVAVLDTGIDAGHDVFQGVTIEERDFTGEGNGDSHGHGTHCAGTIFGQTAGGKRIGVAPGIKKALIGKVLGAQGGSTESIVQAINWALDGGVNVISMSLGMDFPGFVKDLIGQQVPEDLATSIALEAYRANVNLFSSLAGLIRDRGAMLQATVVIAAAGNESRREIDPDFEIAVAPPAAGTGIHAVGALGQGGGGLVVADFSNTKPDIAAPGVGIESAKPGGGYTSMSGTSMATPHVAGVAALWTEKLTSTFGQVNQSALIAKLIASGSVAGLAPGFDAVDVGTGLVQAP